MTRTAEEMALKTYHDIDLEIVRLTNWGKLLEKALNDQGPKLVAETLARRHISLCELARRIGYTVGYLSRVRRGEWIISGEAFQKVLSCYMGHI